MKQNQLSFSTVHLFLSSGMFWDITKDGIKFFLQNKYSKVTEGKKRRS